MHSTGEVACFGVDVQEAFLQALLSTTVKLPEKRPDRYILVSIAEDNMRQEFLESAKMLIEAGYRLAGTPGTAEYYINHSLPFTSLSKPPETGPDSVDTCIKQKIIDLVINVPEGTDRKDELSAGYLMRRAAVDFGISLITNIKCAILLVDAIHRSRPLPCISAEEFTGAGRRAREALMA